MKRSIWAPCGTKSGTNSEQEKYEWCKYTRCLNQTFIFKPTIASYVPYWIIQCVPSYMCMPLSNDITGSEKVGRKVLYIFFLSLLSFIFISDSLSFPFTLFSLSLFLFLFSFSLAYFLLPSLSIIFISVSQLICFPFSPPLCRLPYFLYRTFFSLLIISLAFYLSLSFSSSLSLRSGMKYS